MHTYIHKIIQNAKFQPAKIKQKGQNSFSTIKINSDLDLRVTLRMPQFPTIHGESQILAGLWLIAQVLDPGFDISFQLTIM